MAEFWDPSGEGWAQVVQLSLAFVMCSVIGLEREMQQKSAGLRTHALVGVGSAIYVVVSKYGFSDVASRAGGVVVDPSRVAAQIVSGVGFIGGGLIFVRGDAVQGLTTAAVIWLTAAIGSACGAGLPVVGAIGTACHLIVVLVYPFIVHRLPRSRHARSIVLIQYYQESAALSNIMLQITQKKFSIVRMELKSEPESDRQPNNYESVRTITSLSLTLKGAGSIQGLIGQLTKMNGVISAAGSDTNEPNGVD